MNALEVAGAPVLGEVREREPTGGWGVARTLREGGVEVAFTLSGGHLFPLYDGCVREALPLVDVRHEQTAVHAAEGWAKTTRRRAVAMVTAGPGVTNAVTGMATARQNGSPLLVLAGRAPERGWGRGALQEVDHPTFVAPLTKHASTPRVPADAAAAVGAALGAAWAHPTGPAFVDLPLDVIARRVPFSVGAQPEPIAPPEPDVSAAAGLLAAARRPVIFAGADMYWEHGEGALRTLAERHGLPVLLNGLGRGLLPCDHDLLLSHARREALGHADLVLVLGAPLDFRLSYGLSPLFAPGAALVHVSAREEDHGRAAHLPDRIGVLGSPAVAAAALAGGLAEPKDAIRASRAAWLGSLREREHATLAAERAFLSGAPKGHPLHVYAAVGDILDRDAVVVGDGGDFVSYAGKAIRTYGPGRFLDPGPLGTLGVGPGYALAAQLAYPGKQVLLLLGDGAFGYLPMEFETMARFAAPVVAVVGNNGGQNLERQPMEDLYGYSIAATYEPQVARYHEIVQGMGGHGERVENAGDLRGALERAFASGLPSCINVQLDRDARYPRATDLS